MTEKSLTREAALADWKQRVATSSSDWLLCRNCAGRAAPYRQSGVERKRLPRWAWVLIGVAVLVAIVLIVNALIPKAQARSLGGFDLDRAAVRRLHFRLMDRCWRPAISRRSSVRCENGEDHWHVARSGDTVTVWRSRPMDRYWLRRAKRILFACGECCRIRNRPWGRPDGRRAVAEVKLRLRGGDLHGIEAAGVRLFNNQSAS